MTAAQTNDERALTIGALARLTLTNPAMIREYERLGLLPVPARPSHGSSESQTSHRAYDDSDVRRLTFLRRCRDFGVLNPRLQLLSHLVDQPKRPNAEASEFAQTLLGNVRDQIQELTGLADSLEALLRGDGEKSLAVSGIPSATSMTQKRLRRQIRKPLHTPKSK